jgi:hypothetical protein
MDRRGLLIGGAAALLIGGAAAQAAGKWVKLYNGQDLTGWHCQNGKIEAWKANGELITCSGEGGGWLTSDKEYGDFELRLEYRIPKGGNSGVGLRYPPVGDPAHDGMEIQILDDPAPEYKNLVPAQYTGGIYYQVAPKAHPAKGPGEWNKYEIRCKGPIVQVKLNGVEIQNCNVDEQTTGAGGHKPLSQRPKRGFVGMQSHGNPVDFRNIELREL